MSEDPVALIARYKNQGALLDSNLLILLLIGLVDVRAIARNPHTKEFSPRDFEILRELIFEFGKLVTIPHILTEVSNLGTRKLQGRYREDFSLQLASFVLRAREDRSIAARDLVTLSSYATLGLPDGAILAAVENDILLITADDNLARVASASGREVVPFCLLQQIAR